MQSPFTSSLMKLFKFKRERQPAQGSHLIVLSGAILIGTADGNNIVITPQTAREIAPLLPTLADKAEEERVSD